MRLYAKLIMVICSLFLLTDSVVVHTDERRFHGLQITGSYSIPANFNFQVSDVCSGHDFFYQSTARDDGWFAVYYRHTNRDVHADAIFELVYVDIFDDLGIFQKELSFFTPHDLAVELTQNTVDLYFYNFIISIDLQTYQLTGYTIPNEAAIENGVFAELRSSDYIVGDYRYMCKKSLHGYTQLIREKNEKKEVLLHLSGSGYAIWNTVVPTIMITGIGGLLIWFRRINKRNK